MPGIVVYGPHVYETTVQRFKIAPTGMEPSMNDCFGNAMPAFPHPLPDSVHGKLRRRQPQEKQRDLVAEFLPHGYPTSVTPSRQRRLESKSLALFHVFADPAEHHSPCGQGIPVRRQWTQSSAHQIGVHEQMTIGFIRQELHRESRLARSVRPGDDDDSLGFGHRPETMRAMPRQARLASQGEPLSGPPILSGRPR